MRKALMGLLMAAAAVTPLAPAMARGRDGAPREDRQRSQPRQDNRAEPASQRQQQRVERQQQRAERPQQRAEQRTDRVQQRAGQRVEQPQQRASRPAERAQGAERLRSGLVQQGRARQVPQVRVRQVEQQQRQSARQGSDPRYNRGNWGAQSRDARTADWRNRRQETRTNYNDRGRVGQRRDQRDESQNRQEQRREWSRNWRNDQRYDWQRYRYTNRNIFRGGNYYAPYRGGHYNRFSIGLFLNSGFYSDRYWLTDPWQYRLPPAYAGTRWVRYYDDVMLVDVYTGEVVDVIYDFFW